MGFITEREIKPSNINGNRHDTRNPSIDHKKIGPSLSNIRKPSLNPSSVEKLLEQKAKLLEEKEQVESSKKKGFR